jgi:hypothetical protein
MKEGGFFTQEEVDQAAAVCVLGQTVVDGLFQNNEDPVGKTVRVKDLPCRVIGVFTPKGVSASGQDQDDFIVIPYTTVQKRLTGTFWLDDIFCSATSRETMLETTRQIVGLLRERHHLHQGEPDDFNIRTPEELIRAQLQASHLLTLLLAGTASLALIVGGVGIMNIMLVSITQRTREIGIRMAIGATEVFWVESSGLPWEFWAPQWCKTRCTGRWSSPRKSWSSPVCLPPRPEFSLVTIPLKKHRSSIQSRACGTNEAEPVKELTMDVGPEFMDQVQSRIPEQIEGHAFENGVEALPLTRHIEIGNCLRCCSA